ncbi:MAG: hypothetical protein O3A45_02825 [Proteobacteria bacterium]|nr:hypothetical protein [Pseudomonadota bacterium]MDA1353361.1 hypothetical protein [bacterium]
MHNAKSLGIAGGLTGGIVMLILTILGMMGVGVSVLDVLASLFTGYTISFVGCLIGMIYGFIVGFVLSYIHTIVLSIVETG